MELMFLLLVHNRRYCTILIQGIFPGIKCESLSAFLSSSCCQADSEFSVIGELMDPRARGSFFLKTFSQSFYAMPPVNATQCIHVKDVFK